jgi:hypothetical protein
MSERTPGMSRLRPRGDASPPSHSTIESIEPDAVADYIAAIAAELHKLARENGLDVVAYLLDMACLEAGTTARTIRTAPPEGD